MKRLYIGVLWMVFSLSILQAKEIKMSSPDEKYQFTLSDEGGNLHYSLNWNAKETIKPSLLGIKANTIWRDHLSLGDMTTAEQDTVWHPVYGERSTIKDQYKAWSVVINRQNSRDKLVLDIRAYNEGIAFRYRFPGGQYLKITDEFTEYTLPEGTKAYFTSRAQTPYEFLPLEGWPGESDRPLLLTLPEGPYVCLAEAQVVDYVRTKFKLSTEKKNTIQSAMYGPVEDIAPYHTPWRVIMCADKPGQILEHNDLILNLNPSCKIKDTSWIKPGKVVREVTLTTEGGKALVDFAVKRNLQYIHFDAGWYGFEYDKVSDATTVTLDPRRNPDINALNLKEVVAYAKERGIGVILYVNQRALQQQLDEILPLYKSWGIAGIKFGFVQVGKFVFVFAGAERKFINHVDNFPKVVTGFYFVVQLRENFTNFIFNAFGIFGMKVFEVCKVWEELIFNKFHKVGTREFQMMVICTTFAFGFCPGFPSESFIKDVFIFLAFQASFIFFVFFEGIQVS